VLIPDLGAEHCNAACSKNPNRLTQFGRATFGCCAESVPINAKGLFYLKVAVCNGGYLVVIKVIFSNLLICVLSE